MLKSIIKSAGDLNMPCLEIWSFVQVQRLTHYNKKKNPLFSYTEILEL